MAEDAAAGVVRLLARAKVNLYLHVAGRRADGYHELDSLMVFPDFGDWLEIRPAGKVSLEIAGPFAAQLDGDAEANLVLRAAERLAARKPGIGGAAMRLVKHLPVAAGLGGGSADAAAALKGLARLWGIAANGEELSRIAAELGADVPACLAGHTVRARGIGEVLTRVPGLPPFALLLVNPGVPLPTASVFKARRDALGDVADWPGAVADLDELIDRLATMRNDLEAPAIGIAPEVGQALAEIAVLPGCRLARMSGSGATCFGIFAATHEAHDAAGILKDAQPDWWAVAAQVTNG